MTLEAHTDDRGSVAEVFRNEWFPEVPDFVQGNVSRSKAGVMRGLHYHLGQADLWVPIAGEVTIGLVDLRPGSPTERHHLTFDAGQGIALYIPAGVAHGFYAHSDVTLLYLVDRTFDGGADEHGFHPFDPVAAIEWPVEDPQLSDRDRLGPSLEDAMAAAPVGHWAG